MTTLEDIFNPLDRNAWKYADKDENLTVYPFEICCGGYGRISKTKTEYIKPTYKALIVSKSVKENLKIKHYIKIGEECSICYEPIYYKSNAFLTDCGHSFHTSCINEWIIFSCLAGKCPVCRQDMGYFEIQRYSIKNRLDKLEEFWLNKDTTVPSLCDGFREFDHLSGTNKYCNNCIKYRKCKKMI